MVLSREQAQALTRTIHLLRPAWSEAGIFAALGKCQGRDEFDVALAALRATADKNANTPGVIPGAGSHWNELAPATPKVAPLSREERRRRTCAECGRLDGCTPPKHAFVPLDKATEGRVQRAEIARAELTQAAVNLCPAHHVAPGNCRGAHDAKERK